MGQSAIVLLRVAALVAIGFSAATAVDYYGAVPHFCQPGAGCDSVHAWSSRYHLDLVIPAFGLIFYSSVLLGSLFGRQRLLRLIALAASLGGLGALGFIGLQKFVIGAWCWLCLGVDSAAIVAALAGVVLLRGGAPATSPSAAVRGVWSVAWVLAMASPWIWSTQHQPAPAPQSIVALQQTGTVNVTVLTDPQCPYCRLLHGALEEALADGDDIALNYVLVPLAMHPLARDASKAVICAEPEGQGAAMRNFIYTTEDLQRPALEGEAARLGLDTGAFGTCLDAIDTEARILANIALAEESQMQGLPTVYINGETIVGFDARRGAEPYRAAIERARRSLAQ